MFPQGLVAGAWMVLFASAVVALDVKRLYRRCPRIIGAASANGADAERSLEAAALGEMRAIIDRAMPLREAAAGPRLLDETSALGKIILDPTVA